MLRWTRLFAVAAVIAGGLGFFALAGVAALTAKVAFAVFVVLLMLLSALADAPARSRSSPPVAGQSEDQ